MVLLDAYGEHNVPFALSTVEFLRTVKARLGKDGVVVANLWNSNDKLFKAMLRTYAEVWPVLHVFPAKNDGNAIVVGSSRPLSREAVLERARAVDARIRFRFDYMDAPSRHVPGNSFDTSSSPVLRDAEPSVHEALEKGS